VAGCQAFPQGEGEGCEAEGSDGGPCGFYGGFASGGADALFACVALALDLVLFYEADAAGEDSGEGEEEAADDWAVVVGYEGCGEGYDAAEEEALGVFHGGGFAEGLELQVKSHCFTPATKWPRGRRPLRTRRSSGRLLWLRILCGSA